MSALGLGVDAAGPLGWVGVVVGDHGVAGLHLAPSLADLIADAELAAGMPMGAIGVDIPIGLIDGPRRAVDIAAKAYVGARRASVFWAPHRSAISFPDHTAANEHLAAIGMPKVSAQAFGLFARIRETAEVAAVDDRVVEVFPEASFRALAGADLPAPKKSAAGTLHRLRLLADARPSLVLPTDVEALGPAGRVPMDDLFDAAAAAWSAHRHAHGRAEALGVAEHHNMPGIASSSPAVLIAHLAAGTSTIRLGSGGVMLPNHSPLVIAEQFGMLEALHPGRIDLGLGRAPGTDQLTAAALRRTNRMDSGDDFPNQLGELLGYFNASLPEHHPFHRIHATPARGYQPAIWLLGSSDFSARLAGRLGLPFSFAHHFAGDNTEAAVEIYRRSFEPSEVLSEPYVMLGVNVVCAPTDEEAHRLAQPGALAIARLRQGRPDVYPTPEEAAAYEYSDVDLKVIRGFTANHVVGCPTVVRRGLELLVEATGADELMVTTSTHSSTDRLRSFELVAEALLPAGTTSADQPKAAR